MIMGNEDNSQVGQNSQDIQYSQDVQNNQDTPKSQDVQYNQDVQYSQDVQNNQDVQYNQYGQYYNQQYGNYNYQDSNSYQDSSYRYTKDEIPHDDYMNNAQQFTQNVYAQQDLDSNKDNNKKNKKGRKAVKFIATAAAFGVIASAAFLGSNALYYKINPDAKSNNTQVKSSTENVIGSTDSSNGSGSIATTTITNGKTEYSTDVSDVVEQTMPSIVAITSTVTQSYNDWFGQNYEQDVKGSGSGIIVGKNDTELLIVTNNHVVADAKAIAVQFIDEQIYQAEIKGTDSTADLAVIAVNLKDIKSDTMNQIKIATLGNSDDIKVGQMAIAIGNALGYGQSTTVGYVSAKEREVTIENNKMTLLQTDAAINPGNSGGALLNLAGEVIGINSVKYADNSVEGMGFAIPITRATPIINELMNREKIKEGEEGFLGISGGTVSSDMVSGYGWPEGVYIDSVLEGGPAEEAGILPRDIVTKINDMEVNTIKAMQEKISSYKAGTKVKVTVQRLENGQFVEKTLNATLKKKTDVVKEDTDTTQNDADRNKNESSDGSFQIPGFGN